MATVLLIRHGQASYGEVNYDRLSARGEQQAAEVGKYLAAISVDAMFVGPLTRQQQTARIAAEHAPGLPAPTNLPELAEYPAFDLVRLFIPRLIAEDPEFAELAKGPSRVLADRAFKTALGKWSRDEWEIAGVERVHEFAARVRRGVEAVCSAASSGGRIAVVTSAGPIGVAVGAVFGASAERMIRTSVVVRNASITELVFRSGTFSWQPDHISLLAFNSVAHLPRELHTEY
jgi:broad specificity phosphatase PhoE